MQVGEKVAVGDVLATLEVDGAGAPAVPAARSQPRDRRRRLPRRRASRQCARTPVAERMAQEIGIDLNQVTPTGSAGRVTKEDVQAMSSRTGGAPAAQPASCGT